MVKAAGGTGVTWEEIAKVIGVTKQSSWQLLRHVEDAVRKTESAEERLTGFSPRFPSLCTPRVRNIRRDLRRVDQGPAMEEGAQAEGNVP